MSTEPKNYGAIEEGDKDKSFDATQMQYLGEGKPLTREEKLRKIIRVAVPMLVAALIVGAAVLFLLRDFGYLYPGRGEHQGTKNVVVADGSSSSTATTTTTTTTHASLPSSASSTKTKIDSKCTSHDKCSSLVGNCCPTNDGFFLDCCNQ
eukprot:scaffold1593_cov156-Amphora_coffeaeformis.AAC.6